MKKVRPYLQSNYLSFSFLIAFVSLVGSQFFEHVLAFPPCDLCWYQRIFMYPQAFILGIAMLKKDNSVRVYCLVLSVVGFAVALYHYLLQLFPAVLPCTSSAVACSVKQWEVGIISIPFLSGMAFLMIIVLMLLGKKTSRV